MTDKAKSVLIFGPNGYLGEQFRELYPDACTSNADIAEPELVRVALDEYQPDVVINAAGKTGKPNIDWCEDHKEETVRANVTGPLVLLDECAKRSIYWVHLSSGCIYEGDNKGKGFTEEDAPNFAGSFYSRSKALVDQLLKEFDSELLILRLRMPFDGSNSSRSLINKLKNYERVNDVQNSLTFMPDFMRAAHQLIKNTETGIYNIVNPGTISPFEIMTLYKEVIDGSHIFEKLVPEGKPGVNKVGRSNCVLNTEKLFQKGILLHSIQDAVHLSLEEMKAKNMDLAPVQ